MVIRIFERKLKILKNINKILSFYQINWVVAFVELLLFYLVLNKLKRYSDLKALLSQQLRTTSLNLMLWRRNIIHVKISCYTINIKRKILEKNIKLKDVFLLKDIIVIIFLGLTLLF